MTGYGMAEIHNDSYSIKAELKSLNGKFLDLTIRIPKFLMSKEIELRSKVGNLIERGSAGLYISIVKHKANSNDVQINQALAKQYYTKLKALSEELGAPANDIFKITANMQDVIYQDDDQVDEDLYELVKAIVASAFKQFDEFRKREGQSLKEILVDYVSAILEKIPKIEAFEDERITTVKNRLRKNLVQLTDDENFDKNRFEQEIIYYLEKYDLNEEKTRLATHCKHFLKALEETPKGKSLNFIAQEMGREINTLGSKANHAEIQKIVISMKEDLEKTKEQVLNIL